MRWEDACCRENTSTTILCKMSLVPAKNWSNPQHFSWSTSRILAKMGISWSFSPLQQQGNKRGLHGLLQTPVTNTTLPCAPFSCLESKDLA